MKKAVIAIKGHQYLVAEKDRFKVELIGDEKSLKFEPLMVIDGDTVQVGQPLVSGVSVQAKILDENVADKKVMAIRYKAKKRVNKKRGHRQHHTVIEIVKIS